jgi:hypothetical protein
VAGNPRRWRAILRRWLFVVVFEAVAVSAFLLAAALIDHPVASALPWMDAVWKRVAGAVLLFGTLIALGRSGMLGNPGLRKAHVNPPRWLQIGLFVAVVVAIWSRFPAIAPASLGLRLSALLQNWGVTASIALLLVVAALVVAPRLLARLRHGRTQPATGADAGIDLARADFNRICEWLRTDDEITAPRDDGFGHSRIATRIADRLVQAANGALGRCPTFALIGELGSGKSSVLELVRHSLRERDVLDARVLVISTSLWPFDSAEAAIRGILEAIERGFSRLTSVSSIAHAPARYLRAIGKLDKRAEMAAELLSREKTPVEALEAYGRLAALVGVHVVVWVEDLERFDGSASRDGTRTAPIRALLYQLQRIERLTVVLASDNLNARVDLQKIARFVESIPLLDTTNTWPIISRFRAGCLTMSAAKGQFDPASAKARRELSTAEDSALPLLVQTFGATATLKGAIVHLCRTPRILKQALREALSIWESLLGEIDFDDSLLMCVLRAARPDVFALVDQHVALLRGPSEHRRDARKDDKAFKTELERLIGGDADARMAIDEVLQFVFPASARATSFDTGNKPQGLAVDSPRDYWRRFLSVPPLALAERDQPILRAIADWNAGTSPLLVDIVSDAERSPIAEHFVDHIDPRRVVALLEAVVAARVEDATVNWPVDDDHPDDREPPGVVVVWRMCRRKRDASKLDRGALTSALERMLDCAVPKNLRLAHELIHFFATDSRNVHELLDEPARRQLFERAQELLRGFSRDADRLVGALKGSSRFTLFWATWGFARIHSTEHRSGLPFADWHALSVTILEAGRRSPEVMLPQITSFFLSRADDMEPGTHRLVQTSVFDTDVAKRLFGIAPLSEVFACKDEIIDAMVADRANEIRYVRSQLSALRDAGQSGPAEAPSTIDRPPKTTASPV